ncbi:MAG TPA: hypothetical protein VH518_17985 [Tepidisphaeraceae bacterium]|jgi:hypothetical protein
MTTTPEPATRAKAWRRLGTRGWIGIIGALILTLILSAYLIFSIGADRKYRYAIETIRRAGEPILLTDFPPAALPGDPQSNAATHLRAAATQLSFDSEDEKQSQAIARLPLTTDERQVVTRITDSNQAALNEVRRATACTTVEWDISLTSLLNNAASNEWNQMRNLAHILRFAATREHLEGDDEAAVLSLVDLLAMGRACQKMGPSLISHLIGVGIQGVADDTLVELAPDLRIGDDTHEAPPDDVRKLIDILLDEQGLRRSYADGWTGERAMFVEQVKRNSTAPIIDSLVKLDAVKTLRLFTSLRDAGLETDFPTARARTAAAMSNSAHLHMMSEFAWQGRDVVVQTQFRVTCDRRMTAIVLAIALYRADHDGELPQSLDQLVPTYLPKLPPDPFRADGKTFGYVRNGERPAIYSVSDDGIDGGASTQPVNPRVRGTIDPLSRWQQKDALMYLVRLPRPAPEPDESNPAGTQ